MIRQLLFITLLIFTNSVYADNKEILKAQDILCQTEIKNTALIASGLSNDNTITKDLINDNFTKSLIKSVNACSNQILINNTPHNVAYFMFGEAYKTALNLSLTIFNFSVKNIINNVNKAFPEGYQINLNDLEYIPPFADTESGGFLFLAEMIRTLIYYGIGIILFYILSKFVVQSASGNYDKDGIMNVKRITLAISLLTPLPFLDYVNFAQLILLMVVSFSIIMGNAFFILIYGITYTVDLNSSILAYKDNMTGKNYVAILDNARYKASYDALINGQFQIIEKLEEDIRKNITSTDVIKRNQELPFDTKPNFFNCLREVSYIRNHRAYDKTRTFSFNAVNVCNTIHFRYYDQNSVFTPIDISKNYKDLGAYQVVNFNINQSALMSKIESDTFYIAKELYYHHCKYKKSFKKVNINRPFECAMFNNIGDYQLDYVSDTGRFEIKQTDNELRSHKSLDDRARIIKLKQTYYEQSLNTAKSLFIDETELNNAVGDAINRYMEDQLLSVIKNGFFSAFKILMPKAEFSENHIGKFASKLGKGVTRYSEREERLEIENINKKIVDFEKVFYTFDTDKPVFNSQNDFLKTNYSSLLLQDDYISKTSSSSNCLLNRECNYIMPTNLITHYFVLASNILDAAVGISLVNELMAKYSEKHRIIGYNSLKLVTNLMLSTGIIGFVLIPSMFFLYFATFIFEVIYRWPRSFITISLVAPRLFFLSNKNEQDREDFMKMKEFKLVIQHLREILFSPIFLVLSALLMYMAIWLIAAGNSMVFNGMVIGAKISGVPIIDKYFFLLIYYIVIIAVLIFGLFQYFKFYNNMCQYFDISPIHPSQDLQRIQNYALDMTMSIRPK